MATKVEKKEAAMTTKEAVEALVRKETVLLSDKTEVTVRLCKVKDIPPFLDFLTVIFTELGVSVGDLRGAQESVETRLQDGGFILKLISNNSSAVFDLVARMTDLPREKLDDADLDDAVLVVSKLIEVNYAFFIKRVLPLVSAALVRQSDKPLVTSQVKT